MNLIFRCLTVLLTLIGNEAAFASSGIGNTLDFGELAAFPGAYRIFASWNTLMASGVEGMLAPSLTAIQPFATS